jgi:hypothetical protein
MRKSLKLSVVFLGLVFVLGVPPILLLTTAPAPNDTRAAAVHDEAVLRLLESRSTLHARYQAWESRYVAGGGDRDVQLALGYVKGLSTVTSLARGTARLDLLAGTVEVAVEGLAGGAVVWLVDNQPGAGASVLPEPGDHMVKVGSLDAQGRARNAFGRDFFDRFELDLVVVSAAGSSPTESRLLLGGRPLFERLYTKTRVAMRAPRSPLARLASLGSQLLAPPAAEADAFSVLVSHGLVSRLVADGAELFFRGTFGGNGRSCGTCHPVNNDQEVGPESIAQLPASDPIFIAEKPASQGGVPGLEIPALMRQFGMILENLDGAEDPTNKFVMRGVPHSLSMATSIAAPADGRAPVERTGWSGDGAPITGALRFFPTGAVFQHYTKSLERRENIDFVFPTDDQLDKMEAFMLTSGRTNDLVLANVSLTNPGAEAGRLTFLSAAARCNGCHSNAGANIATGVNFNFNTGVEERPHAAQAVQPHPKDGGFGLVENSPGVFGDGTFNTAPLVEVADTPPFFHNNVIDTVEDAVRFYSGPEFNSSPAAGAGINLTEQQNLDIAAFLRVINAAFNIAQALHRVQAAAELENVEIILSPDTTTNFPSGDEVNGRKETVDALLALANFEAADAIEVLYARGLNPTAQAKLQEAIDFANQAINANATRTRRTAIQKVATALNTAKIDLGSGMSFTIGEGNLLF